MALPLSAQAARDRRDMRLDGYRPTVQGAVGPANPGVDPFSNRSLSSRTNPNALNGALAPQMSPRPQGVPMAPMPQFSQLNPSAASYAPSYAIPKLSQWNNTSTETAWLGGSKNPATLQRKPVSPNLDPTMAGASYLFNNNQG